MKVNTRGPNKCSEMYHENLITWWTSGSTDLCCGQVDGQTCAVDKWMDRLVLRTSAVDKWMDRLVLWTSGSTDLCCGQVDPQTCAVDKWMDRFVLRTSGWTDLCCGQMDPQTCAAEKRLYARPVTIPSNERNVVTESFAFSLAMRSDI